MMHRSAPNAFWGLIVKVDKGLANSNPDISNTSSLLVPYNFCIKTLFKEFDCYLNIRCKEMNVIK